MEKRIIFFEKHIIFFDAGMRIKPRLVLFCFQYGMTQVGEINTGGWVKFEWRYPGKKHLLPV